MSDVKTVRRLDALTKWADWAVARGFPVPSHAELADIAAEPEKWRNRIDSSAAREWGHTIDYVLNQQKLGVVADEIVRSLSDEYVRPRGSVANDGPPALGNNSAAAPMSAPPAPAPAKSSDPVVGALTAWRERRIADGADGADLIKVTTLRNLVKFGYTDAETIRRKLPGQAAYLGGEIAEIIAAFTEATTGSVPTSTPPTVPDTPAPPEIPPVATQGPLPRPPRTGTPRVGELQPQAGLLNLTHDDFCEFRYQTPDSDGVDGVIKPRPIRGATVEGGVRLSYEAFVPDAGRMVIYRVVAADGSPPRKPEAGDLVGATTELQIEDRREIRAAVRAYQVWCHVGIDQEDAARNNPFLLARGQEVSPVSNFEIHVAEGRVSGEWSVFPGAQRVRVYRIPMDGIARLDDPQHEICRTTSNVEGFADLDAAPGLRYLYRACVEVSVNGSTQLSRPTEEELTVPVALAPVEDLSITPSTADAERVDLEWTAPPIGRVRVYWASARPRADVGKQHDLTQSRLSIVDGFRDEDRIKGPTDKLNDGRARIAGVAWPSEWPRVYVTPVTVLGEQVRVGTTRVETRQLPPVSNAEILERYDTEMVTFGWPAEAASVLVYLGATTMPPEEIVQRNNPVEEVWYRKYERDGGITFDKKLEAKGCTVVLVPVNYSQRQAVQGQLAALHYPGLHRIKYDLVKLRGDPTRYLTELHLANSLDIDSAIALTMVNRRDRLPLSPNDGEPVYFLPRDGGEPTPQCLIQELKKGQSATGWRADWTVQRGYFRLFISSQADQSKKYALADPPVRDLYFDPAIPPPGASQ